MNNIWCNLSLRLPVSDFIFMLNNLNEVQRRTLRVIYKNDWNLTNWIILYNF